MNKLLNSRKRDSKGFSLVELLVVVAIIMIISAMAMPNLLKSVSKMRLRMDEQDYAGLLTRARMDAVRTNTFRSVRTGASAGNPIGYIDTGGAGASANGSGNGAYDAGEPSTQMTANTTFPALVGTPIGIAQLGFVPRTDVPPTFNARGLPCLVAAGICTNVPPVGFARYFTSSDGLITGAVTLSPAGRSKVWVLEGTTWTN
jgi:prepilin-type N-terminal cleavage/methylation domain-containing protein